MTNYCETVMELNNLEFYLNITEEASKRVHEVLWQQTHTCEVTEEKAATVSTNFGI